MTADLAAWLLADDGPIAADEQLARSAIDAYAPPDGQLPQGVDRETARSGTWWATADTGRSRNADHKAREEHRSLIRPQFHAATEDDDGDPTYARAPVIAHLFWTGPRVQSVMDHIAAWDPARALAECAAKRAIVEAYQTAYPGDDVYGLERAVILLAQPYAGRRGWRDDWRTS